MDLALILKLLHIVIAFGFVGGVLGRTFAMGQASRTADVTTIQALVQLGGRFEYLLVRPGSLLLLLGGLLTAWVEGWPILGFLQGGATNWVLASLVLYLSTVPLIIAVFLPRGRIFETALREAVAQNQVTPRLTAAFHDQAVTAAHIYEWVALGAIILLMVLKPF